MRSLCRTRSGGEAASVRAVGTEAAARGRRRCSTVGSPIAMAEDNPQVRSQRYRDVLDYEVGARVVVELTTRGREVIDYAVVLTVDEDAAAVTVRATTARMASTTCTATIARVRRRRRCRFMPVLLEKGCAPRSSRFASDTGR